MDNAEKTKIALAACAAHTEEYGTKIPDRVVQFWKSGEAFKLDMKCIPDGAFEIPGWGDGSKRLGLAVPSWPIQAGNALDDAIVGPDGDWEFAKLYLPLFHVEQSRFVVVRLDDPKCPVGFYDEECWDSDGDGYKKGVFMLAASLDQFVRGLVDLDEAECETEDHGDWDMEDEGEDDDDEESEDDE
jgi:hypothetical protein